MDKKLNMREYLQGIAKETVEVSERGSYNHQGKLVLFDKNTETMLFKNSDFDVVLDFVHKMVSEKEKPTIEVINGGTVDSVLRLTNGKVDKYGWCRNIGVLNFASAYNPGGGFLGGSVAQEECLAYCSDLYTKQLSNNGPEFYEINKSVESKMYTNTMLVSDVTFFRDSNYSFLETPRKVWVITSPAVNMGQIIKRGESVKQANAVMKNRMKKILYLFANVGCTDIILGAFGCGVFGNNPENISQFWYELLIEEDMKKYFNSITFSIIDKASMKESNLETFKIKFNV